MVVVVVIAGLMSMLVMSDVLSLTADLYLKNKKCRKKIYRAILLIFVAVRMRN